MGVKKKKIHTSRAKWMMLVGERRVGRVRDVRGVGALRSGS